jgi:carbamoyl-phosphate synthase large subunit
MEILYSQDELADYFARADAQTAAAGILLDKFLDDAIEVDVDAVCDGKRVVVGGVMEHIEQAGVHSGDSACSLPPHSLDAKTVAALRAQTDTLARALGVVGLINIQFAICNKEKEIYVLEVNPRASRTAPFVSKATGLPIAKIAARAMAGVSLDEQGVDAPPTPPYFSVKEAVFPFEKFPGADVLLGPEMKSTGEVMGIGATFAAAFCRAQSAIYKLPDGGGALFSVRNEDKPKAAAAARRLTEAGFKIYATAGTAAYLNAHGVCAQAVKKVTQGRPNVVDLIFNAEAQIQIVVNTVERSAKSVRDSFSIRQSALQRKVVYSTTVAGGDAASRGIADLILRSAKPPIASLQEHHRACARLAKKKTR